MILKLFTEHVVYYVEGHEDVYSHSDKITIRNCKFEQTSYGSVIITRLRPNNHIVELYPSSISHIIHIN